MITVPSLSVTWKISLCFHYKPCSSSEFLKSLSLASYILHKFFFLSWQLESEVIFLLFSHVSPSPNIFECQQCAGYHATVPGANTLEIYIMWYQALCSLLDNISDIFSSHIISKWKQGWEGWWGNKRLTVLCNVCTQLVGMFELFLSLSYFILKQRCGKTDVGKIIQSGRSSLWQYHTYLADVPKAGIQNWEVRKPLHGSNKPSPSARLLHARAQTQGLILILDAFCENWLTAF